MCSAFVSPNGLKNDEYHICSALVSRHGFKIDECYMCSALVWPHGWEIFSVSREMTSGGSDRLFPRRTVSIRSDQVCLPRSSTPLAPVSLLLSVPLIKCLTPISGSSQNRTQSASWWRQPDSGRVYWTCMAACIKNKWNEISNNETRFTFTEWFQIFQQMEPVERIFMKLLVVYLHCTWTVTLPLVDWKFLLVKSISYPPLSFLCNAKIAISARVVLMFSWMRLW